MRKDNHLSPPISECIAVFRLHCKAQRYKPKTLQFYEEKLTPFADWLAGEGVSQIDQVTAHHVRAYLVYKQTIYPGTEDERQASGHTIHGIARALRAFFNFCVSEDWLTVSPMATVKMPRRPKRILEAYSPGELKALFKAAKDDREKAILYVLLDTGVRASECISIRVSDINWGTNSIQILGGKGEKDRIVYFGARTARLLIRYIRGLDSRGFLFTNAHTGRQFTYNGFGQLLRRIGKAANVPCTAHKFRRTFAINSLRNGMNVYYLAKLMGHEDISILKPYLEILNIDLQRGQDNYGVVDNL